MKTLTLRLDDHEEKKLEWLMNKHDIKTASKTIKKIIESFQNLYEKTEKALYENVRIAEELEELKEAILDRQRAKQKVNTAQGRITKLAKR